MKTIILNNVSYNLVDSPNVSADRLQATILKENHTVETIAEDAKGNEEITVKENDEIIGIYTGYLDLLAVSLYKHDKDDVVSVEILNNNLQTQVNTLFDTVEENKAMTDSAVSSLQSEVNTKVDSSIIAEIEIIAGQSKNPYKVGETFMGNDGNYYKVTAPIITGNILVVYGNIEPTTINNTIKESEEEV